MWCYADPSRWSSGRIDLDETEVHHAVNVMRLRAGDKVHVLDGKGRCACGPLNLDGRRAAHVEVSAESTQPCPTLSSVTLAAALCKPARWDWMLEKAAELGVGRFLPLLTDHCVSRPTANKSADKIDKWKAVFIRACKQSHNAWLPEMPGLMTLSDWLADDSTIRLAGAITDDARPLAEALPGIPLTTASTGVVIGPEGDFSDAEYEQLRRAGVHMLSLGPRILRCETAALYVLNALQYEIERQHHA